MGRWIGRMGSRDVSQRNRVIHYSSLSTNAEFFRVLANGYYLRGGIFFTFSFLSFSLFLISFSFLSSMIRSHSRDVLYPDIYLYRTKTVYFTYFSFVFRVSLNSTLPASSRDYQEDLPLPPPTHSTFEWNNLVSLIPPSRTPDIYIYIYKGKKRRLPTGERK